MRALFICSRNRIRSPTAEAIFAAYPNMETASAGTARDAEEVVSADLLTWADTIFTMESVHRRRLQSMFPSLMRDKRVIVLGIRDEYPYMDAKLIEVLKQKVEPHLR